MIQEAITTTKEFVADMCLILKSSTECGFRNIHIRDVHKMYYWQAGLSHYDCYLVTRFEQQNPK